MARKRKNEDQSPKITATVTLFNWMNENDPNKIDPNREKALGRIVPLTGKQLNQMHHKGVTLLECAIAGNHVDIVEELIGKGVYFDPILYNATLANYHVSDAIKTILMNRFMELQEGAGNPPMEKYIPPHLGKKRRQNDDEMGNTGDSFSNKGIDFSDDVNDGTDLDDDDDDEFPNIQVTGDNDFDAALASPLIASTNMDQINFMIYKDTPVPAAAPASPPHPQTTLVILPELSKKEQLQLVVKNLQQQSDEVVAKITETDQTILKLTECLKGLHSHQVDIQEKLEIAQNHVVEYEKQESKLNEQRMKFAEMQKAMAEALRELNSVEQRLELPVSGASLSMMLTSNAAAGFIGQQRVVIAAGEQFNNNNNNKGMANP